ncbi:hypothetical protein FRB95_012460 [Tulasnella sp. JGI-2019a]|nr:hypothetical protein FRB95_012460 [Tulasnella sp. JGI-2019a]
MGGRKGSDGSPAVFFESRNEANECGSEKRLCWIGIYCPLHYSDSGRDTFKDMPADYKRSSLSTVYITQLTATFPSPILTNTLTTSTNSLINHALHHFPHRLHLIDSRWSCSYRNPTSW